MKDVKIKYLGAGPDNGGKFFHTFLAQLKFGFLTKYSLAGTICSREPLLNEYLIRSEVLDCPVHDLKKRAKDLAFHEEPDNMEMVKAMFTEGLDSALNILPPIKWECDSGNIALRSRTTLEKKLHGGAMHWDKHPSFTLFENDEDGNSKIRAETIEDAQYILGKDIQGKNPERSFVFFSLSAKKGHTKSQFELGQLYEEGIGVEQDREKALQLYKIAAEKGHVGSQMRLAAAYFLMLGTQRNLVDSYTWVVIAYANGYVDRLKEHEFRTMLLGEMSKSEILLALQRADSKIEANSKLIGK